MNRYDLARYGSTLAVAALSVVLFAPAAMAGSNCCAARAAVAAKASCASPAVASTPAACAASSKSTVSAVSAPARVSSAQAWMPAWIGPVPSSDVPDYAALYAPALAAPAPGMIIAIDPETGMPMKPSEAQLRALTMDLESTDALAPTEAPMLMESLPGGGVAVTLNGHFQMYSIARIGADGRIVTDCAHDAATAKRMLVAPAPRVVRAEKE